MAKTKTWVLMSCAGLAALGAVALAALGFAGAPIAAGAIVLLAAGACGIIFALRRHMDQACREYQEEHSKALQAELRRSRGFTLSVMDALPHAVALVSPAGRVEMANARAGLFGMEVGKEIAAAGEPWLKNLLAEAVAGRAPAAEEEAHIVQRFEEGRECMFLPRATPLMNGDGKLEGITVVLIDVTSSRQADEAKSDLMSSFSHELKTPMTSLQMSLYLLIDDAASRLTPRQLDLLKAARDDADRLHRLVEEVLAAARLKL